MNEISIDIYKYKRISYLMAGEHQCVRDNYILSATCCENNNLGNILRGQWFATAVYCQLGAFFSVLDTYA